MIVRATSERWRLARLRTLCSQTRLAWAAPAVERHRAAVAGGRLYTPASRADGVIDAGWRRED